jgi:putative oxidoreductase
MNHDFTTLTGIAGPLTLAGGVLVILGVFTRPVTFALSGMMAVAFFADSVARNGNLWTLKDGEAAVFYCFAFLVFSASGGGVLSLDHLIWRKNGEPYPFASPKWSPYLISIMRFMMGFMFIQHGTEKLWGFPSGRIDHNFLSLHGFAGLLELPGGILMMLGLFTRPVSFILSGQMAVAYWARWAPRGFWRSLIVGEASIYFCFAFLLMSAIGGGALSLDHLWSRMRKRSAGAAPAGELVSSSRS